MSRRFNFRGLQTKTAGILSLLLVLIIAGLIIMNLMDLRSTSQKEVRDSCQMLSGSAYNAVLHPMSINDTETIQQQMRAYGRSMKDVDVFIFGSNHGVTYSSRKQHVGGDLRKIISSTELQSALAGLFSTGALSTNCFIEQSGGRTHFITIEPMKNEKRCHHCHGTSRSILGGVLVSRDITALTAHQARVRLRNILIGCAGILISMALIWILLRVLVIKPVDRLVEASGHMAQGDMTYRVDSGRKDELGALAESIDKTTESLGAVIREVENQAGHLADGVSQQAAAIEETAAGTEEISIMLRKNAENSQEVQSLLGQTISDMQQARESMRSLSENMAQTSAASDEVAKIIKSIDEIAFQTNLLALNAAVEAARAGESGAGFAVVADEVRNLALRAAAAAEQTNEMISSIVNKIKESHQLVDESDGNYRNVAVKIRKVAELSDDIAVNASEQAQGITQLNNAMSTIDGVTQQQAAMAQSLAEMMSRFTVQAQDRAGGNERSPTGERKPLLLEEGPRT